MWRTGGVAAMLAVTLGAAGAQQARPSAKEASPAREASAPKEATPATDESVAKKDLVAKVLKLTQANNVEQVARNLVEQPAYKLLTAADQALRASPQIPADKREALGRQVQGEVRLFVQQNLPLVRERAIKLAPVTLGTSLEERFSEEELKQLVAWLESPVNRKYQDLVPEMQNQLVQELVAEFRPTIEPKLKAIEERFIKRLGVPRPASAASAASAPASGPRKR